jgi:hypothetical protein
VNSPMIKRALSVALGFFGICFPVAAQQANRPERTEGQTTTLEQSWPADAFDAAFALSLYRPEIFSTADSSLLLPDYPALTWLDGARLPILSSLAEMGIGPLNLFRVALLSAARAPAKKRNADPAYRSDGKNFGTDGKDSPAEMMNSPLNPVYWGGEVGVLYGQWSGKGGGDLLQTYIMGTVGNDKFQITAGAAYEESSGRALRFRSFPVPR